MYHPCSNSNSGSSFNGNDLIISSSSSSYPIQPFSTIESNPSSNSKDNNELDQTNCDNNNNNNNNNNTLFPLPLPLPLPFPPPLPLTFFQVPYSPFEDNEIFLHHHHHNDVHDDLFLHHHHQSLAAPPPNETSNSGIVNMEVTITTATATASRTPTKNKVIPANTVKAHVHDDDDDQIRITRRRSSKRDRHSKIKTARGLRDRRMRLSLDVAKRFFGLQDMLGFDKASKTVEWLLNQAKSEIKQLARDHKNKNKNNNSHHLPSCYDNNNNNYCSTSFFGAKSASSTNSECIEEGVSSLDEVALSGNHHHQEGHNEDGEKVDVPTAKAKKRSRSSNRKNSSRKSVFNTIGKESREKARERARERTMEKKKKMMMTTMMMRTNANSNNNKQCNNNEEIVMMTNHSGLNRLGLWNPFERTVVEESQISSVMIHSSFDVLIDEPEPELEDRSSRAKDDNTNSNQQQLHLGNCCVDDDSFVIMNRWSPTMILNSLNNPGILQEHQFTEFQSMGKPWEDYNNHI